MGGSTLKYKFEVIETIRLERCGKIESITTKAILTNIGNRKATYKLPKPKPKTSGLPAYHPGSYLVGIPKITQHCEWAGKRETGKLRMFAFIAERDLLPYWFTYDRNTFPLEMGESIEFETTAIYIRQPRFSSWASSVRSGYKLYYGHLKPRPAQFVHKFRLSTPRAGFLRRSDIRSEKTYDRILESGDRVIYEWSSDSEVELIKFRADYRHKIDWSEALKQLKP